MIPTCVGNVFCRTNNSPCSPFPLLLWQLLPFSINMNDGLSENNVVRRR